jgi:NAD(P)H-hydrate epimerase
LAVAEQTDPPVIDPAWVAANLPDRSARAHKGTFGRLLVIGGSLEYAGAPLLVGLGAARAGAGLVAIAAPEAVALRLLGRIPELIWLPLQEEAAGLTSPAGWRRVTSELGTYDAAVIGPGLGRHPSTWRRTRGLLADLRVPAVIDADALNALAEHDRWWQALRAPLVLTPHPGEFATLSGRGTAPPPDEAAARATAAAEAAERWAQVVVLKGADTVIASPEGETVRSSVATPALATAGSGDVLSGIIGALLAAGSSPWQAAVCGVAAHAGAGVIAERRIGRSGAMATDISSFVPAALTALRAGQPA